MLAEVKNTLAIYQNVLNATKPNKYNKNNKLRQNRFTAFRRTVTYLK